MAAVLASGRRDPAETQQSCISTQLSLVTAPILPLAF